jgi:hypothetical protein
LSHFSGKHARLSAFKMRSMLSNNLGKHDHMRKRSCLCVYVTLQAAALTTEHAVGATTTVALHHGYAQPTISTRWQSPESKRLLGYCKLAVARSSGVSKVLRGQNVPCGLATHGMEYTESARHHQRKIRNQKAIHEKIISSSQVIVQCPCT